MEMLLIRNEFTEISTIGDLFIPSDELQRFCFTLEDRVRDPGIKIAGETAIPFGRYEVVYTWSDKFQRKLPLLLGVPMFTGIRMHAGQTAKDTAGCICVGQYKEENKITGSGLALGYLLAKLMPAWDREKVWISIQRG